MSSNKQKKIKLTLKDKTINICLLTLTHSLLQNYIFLCQSEVLILLLFKVIHIEKFSKRNNGLFFANWVNSWLRDVVVTSASEASTDCNTPTDEGEEVMNEFVIHFIRCHVET